VSGWSVRARRFGDLDEHYALVFVGQEPAGNLQIKHDHHHDDGEEDRHGADRAADQPMDATDVFRVGAVEGPVEPTEEAAAGTSPTLRGA